MEKYPLPLILNPLLVRLPPALPVAIEFRPPVMGRDASTPDVVARAIAIEVRA